VSKLSQYIANPSKLVEEMSTYYQRRVREEEPGAELLKVDRYGRPIVIDGRYRMFELPLCNWFVENVAYALNAALDESRNFVGGQKNGTDVQWHGRVDVDGDGVRDDLKTNQLYTFMGGNDLNFMRAEEVLDWGKITDYDSFIMATDDLLEKGHLGMWLWENNEGGSGHTFVQLPNGKRVDINYTLWYNSKDLRYGAVPLGMWKDGIGKGFKAFMDKIVEYKGDWFDKKKWENNNPVIPYEDDFGNYNYEYVISQYSTLLTMDFEKMWDFALSYDNN
jgi:hypothetical protein